MLSYETEIQQISNKINEYKKQKRYQTQQQQNN
jgi:hypothetical protein